MSSEISIKKGGDKNVFTLKCYQQIKNIHSHRTADLMRHINFLQTEVITYLLWMHSFDRFKLAQLSAFNTIKSISLGQLIGTYFIKWTAQNDLLNVNKEISSYAIFFNRHTSFN